MRPIGNLFSGTQSEMSSNIAPSEKFIITPGTALLNKPISPQQYVVEGLVPRKAITRFWSWKRRDHTLVSKAYSFMGFILRQVRYKK